MSENPYAAQWRDYFAQQATPATGQTHGGWTPPSWPPQQAHNALPYSQGPYPKPSWPHAYNMAQLPPQMPYNAHGPPQSSFHPNSAPLGLPHAPPYHPYALYPSPFPPPATPAFTFPYAQPHILPVPPNPHNLPHSQLIPSRALETINKETASIVKSVQANEIFSPPHPSSSRIVIILRGLPGTGKTHVAQLLSALETKRSGAPARIVSLDDYCMEERDEGDPLYEDEPMVFKFDLDSLPSYAKAALRTFKRLLSEDIHKCIIYDAVNARNNEYADVVSAAIAAGCEVFVCESSAGFATPQDLAEKSQNKYSTELISKWMKEWEEAPLQLPKLFVENLIKSGAFSIHDAREVEMEGEREKEDDAGARQASGGLEAPKEDVKGRWDEDEEYRDEDLRWKKSRMMESGDGGDEDMRVLSLKRRLNDANCSEPPEESASKRMKMEVLVKSTRPLRPILRKPLSVFDGDNGMFALQSVYGRVDDDEAPLKGAAKITAPLLSSSKRVRFSEDISKWPTRQPGDKIRKTLIPGDKYVVRTMLGDLRLEDFSDESE